MIKTLIDVFYRILEGILVILLAGMTGMVFVNVVMRYAFSSGIDVSEELARYCFVWVSFIGAVVTFREGAHLGVETFVARLSRAGRLFCMGMANLVIMGCSAVFFWGSWEQAPLNLSMAAPVTGLPMIWVYGIGLFTGGGMFLIGLERFIRVVTGRITDAEIAAFAGETHDLEQLLER